MERNLTCTYRGFDSTKSKEKEETELSTVYGHILAVAEVYKKVTSDLTPYLAFLDVTFTAQRDRLLRF